VVSLIPRVHVDPSRIGQRRVISWFTFLGIQQFTIQV
jgi:hypothetical protein